MKKRFGKWIKPKLFSVRPERNETHEDNGNGEQDVMPAEVEDSTDSSLAVAPVDAPRDIAVLPRTAVTVANKPPESSGVIENYSAGEFHVTLSEDECGVCKWRKGNSNALGSYKGGISNEEILPIDFIKNVDEKFSGLVPIEECQEIRKAVLDDVRTQHPAFYDFCVICSDDDYQRANQFKILVANAFSLSGCMLHDGFIRLGSDIFQSYEVMIDHCSKVFFFITESFNANDFCRRLQSGTVFNSLMSRAYEERQKCVPVFPNGHCRVPLPLAGIAGILPRNHDTLNQSLNCTFTLENRKQLALKNQHNNELRAIKYLELFQRSIEDRKYQREALEDRIDQVKSKSDQMLLSLSTPMIVPAVEMCEVQGHAPPVRVTGDTEFLVSSKPSASKDSESIPDSECTFQSKHSSPCSEPSSSEPRQKNHKLRARPSAESLVNEVLSKLSKILPNRYQTKSVNKSYEIHGGDVHVGDNINIYVQTQLNSSVVEFDAGSADGLGDGASRANSQDSDSSDFEDYSKKVNDGSSSVSCQEPDLETKEDTKL